MRDPKQAGETLYPPRFGGWPGAASNPADTRIKDGLGVFWSDDEKKMMTKQPECFDEWKHNCAHGSKVLSVGQRSVGGRPETCRFTSLHSTNRHSTDSLAQHINNRHSTEGFHSNLPTKLN